MPEVMSVEVVHNVITKAVQVALAVGVTLAGYTLVRWVVGRL